MKFHYSILLLLFVICFSCKKESDNIPNYFFGKYSPFCGIVPPCSDKFWLINKDGKAIIGASTTNIFTMVDSNGQVTAVDLTEQYHNYEITTTNPVPIVPKNFKAERTSEFINLASTISSNCYNMANATAFFNSHNYFVFIPVENNQVQAINLNNCKATLTDKEGKKIDTILDWLKSIDEQLEW